MSLKDKVHPLSEASEYINMLVFADSGAGKTVLAGSDDSVLFAAPEDDGLLSAQRMGSKADKYEVTQWEDLMQLYKDLYELVELDEEIPYKWLCIDSITEMQSMCMRYILRRVVAENPDRDPDVPAIGDWQRYYIIFEKMVRAFNDLPVNVLYTALARKVEDADGNEFMIPEIQGKDYGIAMKTVSYMTSYGYMMREIVEKPVPVAEGEEPRNIKVRQRVIYFEDNGVFRGKDRTLALGSKLVLPPKGALKMIRTKIENYGKEPAQPAKAVSKKAAAKAPVKATSKMPATAKTGVAAQDKAEKTAEVKQMLTDETTSNDTKVASDAKALLDVANDDPSLEMASAEA